MKDATVWIDSKNWLGVYSLGEEKYSYQLPDGAWKVVGANADSFLIYNNDEIECNMLGKTAKSPSIDHIVIVLYLFGLFVFQIVIGIVAYRQLRRKY